MKILQLILAVLMFCLAGALCVCQIVATRSVVIGLVFVFGWLLMGGLVYLSWGEFKEEAEQ